MAVSLELNKVGNANGQFLGSSSACPIAGDYLRDIFSQEVIQAKVTVDDVAPGMPCSLSELQEISKAADADYRLNPNTVIIGTAGDDVKPNGFVLISPSDVLLPGDEAARPLKNQIVNVALIGSGITMYLPVSSNSSTILPGGVVEWDATGGSESEKEYGVIASSSVTSQTFRAIGNPVNGRKFVINTDGSCSFQSCKVIKVKL